ncbi:regulator of condensation [Trichuris suis]|nr:regulator of condensation [Trichuris suis]
MHVECAKFLFFCNAVELFNANAVFELRLRRRFPFERKGSSYELRKLWMTDSGASIKYVAHYAADSIILVAMSTLNKVVIVALLRGTSSFNETHIGEYEWYSMPEKEIVSIAFSPTGHWLFLQSVDGDIHILHVSMLVPTNVLWNLPFAQEALHFSREEISALQGRKSTDFLDVPTSLLCFLTLPNKNPTLAYGNKRGDVYLVNPESSVRCKICSINESVRRLEYARDPLSHSYLLVTGSLGAQWTVPLQSSSIKFESDCFRAQECVPLPVTGAFIVDSNGTSTWAHMEADALSLYHTNAFRNPYFRIPLPPSTDIVKYTDLITFACNVADSRLEYVINCCIPSPASAAFNCTLVPTQLPGQWGPVLECICECDDTHRALPACVVVFRKGIFIAEPIQSPTDVCRQLLKLYRHFSFAEAWCNATQLDFRTLGEEMANKFMLEQEWEGALKMCQRVKMSSAEIIKVFAEFGALHRLWGHVKVWLCLQRERESEFNRVYNAAFEALLNSSMQNTSSEETSLLLADLNELLTSYPCPNVVEYAAKIARLGYWTTLLNFAKAQRLRPRNLLQLIVDNDVTAERGKQNDHYYSLLVYVCDKVTRLPQSCEDVLSKFFKSVASLTRSLSPYWLECLWKRMNLDVYSFPDDQLSGNDRNAYEGKFEVAFAYRMLYLNLLCQLDNAISESCHRAGIGEQYLEKRVECWCDIPLNGLAAGLNSSCVLTSDLNIRTYGEVVYNGCSLVANPAAKILIRQVACGFRHAVFLDYAGMVHAVGDNHFGQVGLENESWFAEAKLVLPRQGLVEFPVKKVTCGAYHSAAILANGTVVTWGWNVHGQLGHGNAVDKTIPTPVEQFVEQAIRLSDVQCGYAHTLFLSDEGILFVCGSNARAQLGLSSQVRKVSRPTCLTLGKVDRIRCIACSLSTNLALSDGHPAELWSWGKSSSSWQRFLNMLKRRGAEGNVSKKNNRERALHQDHVPVLVNTTELCDEITSLHCGFAHFAVVTTSGSVYTWGDNDSYQLGSKGLKRRKYPSENTKVALKEAASSVALGSNHSLVIDRRGTLWGFGKRQSMITHKLDDQKDDCLSKPTLLEADYKFVVPDRRPIVLSAWRSFVSVTRCLLRGCRNRLTCMHNLYIGSFCSPMRLSLLLLLSGAVKQSFQVLKERVLREDCNIDQLTDVLSTYELYFNCCKSDSALRSAYVESLVSFTEACVHVPCVKTFFCHHRGLTPKMFRSIATISNSPAVLFDLLIGESILLESSPQVAYGTVELPSTTETKDLNPIYYYACGHSQGTEEACKLAFDCEQKANLGQTSLPAGFVRDILLPEFLANYRNTKMCFTCWVKITSEAIVNDLFYVSLHLSCYTAI